MAIERGHRVRALVRSKASLEEHDGLELVEGDVLDPVVVQRVMDGCDAVISCLGIRKETPSDPWSPLTSPEDFTAQSAKYTVNAMKSCGVERLIGISSAGVGESWSRVDPSLRSVIETSNIGIVFRDLDNMEKVCRDSRLDTLAVRPVALVSGNPTGSARIVDSFEPSSKISTGDVALWMLDAVERPTPFDRRTEMIGWAPPAGADRAAEDSQPE
jgi:putative NADH-flavin reductase